MRVGIFTDTYLPDCNGVAAAVSALARELAAIGHHACIIAPEGSHTFDENLGFTHIYLPTSRHERIPLPLCWSALGWPKSKRIVNSEFDIIHAHGLGPVGAYGARIAHRLNIPLVLTIHTDVLAYVAHYRLTARLATPLQHILLYQLRRLLQTAELQGTRGGDLLEQLLRSFCGDQCVRNCADGKDCQKVCRLHWEHKTRDLSFWA
jgi:glycosyltransferase involved in cell wall biosynthesis